MSAGQTSALDLSIFSRVIFLFLLGLWSGTQLISVLGFLPDALVAVLYNSKNILGALLVAWSLLVITSQFLRHRVIPFDKNLFIFAILFPLYVTLINIIRYEISWKEVLLYWLWVTAVYLAFPAMLQGEGLRRKAIKVLFWTNLLVLFVGISLGVLKSVYYTIEHGNKLLFGFVHPNYYCQSWQVVFAIAFYFALTVKRKWLKIVASFLVVCSAVFMLLAVSRNTFVASMILIAFYVLLNRRWSFFLKYIVAFFILFSLFLAFLLIDPSVAKIDKISTGRFSIWRMTLESNLNKASAMDYLLGFGRYKIEGYPVDPDKLAFRKELSVRSHVDNSYLDIFLQNGIIGFLLFFIPLLTLVRRTLINAASTGEDLLFKEARIYFACWVGILVQIFTSSLIPSFGNVINIFILVFMCPMALKSLRVER